MSSHSDLRNRPKAKSVQPLRALGPFLAPYRGLMIAAAVALVVASAAMLAVPNSPMNAPTPGLSHSTTATPRCTDACIALTSAAVNPQQLLSHRTAQLLHRVLNAELEGLEPEEAADALLQRGTRLDESTPGHGIGLAVVKDIAQSYGGDLSITASDLGGAEIRVELPSRQAGAR